jgi:hypothetical protein
VTYPKCPRLPRHLNFQAGERLPDPTEEGRAISPADPRDSAWGAPASCSTPASQVGRTRQSSRSSSRDLANALAAGPRDERGTRDQIHRDKAGTARHALCCFFSVSASLPDLYL